MNNKNYADISVIIPCYNSSKTIIRALESVINQTYKNFEIILIDDGSIDNTKELIESFFINKEVEYKYIYQKNSGPSTARNNGVINSNGEYIAFLDSDDMWHPQKLELVFEAMKDGFDGFYFISDQCLDKVRNKNLFDAYMHSTAMFRNRNLFQKIVERLVGYHSWTFLGPIKYSYKKMMKNMYKDLSRIPNFIPSIFTGWDTTARHGNRGVILKDFDVQSFDNHVKEIFNLNMNNEFIFIKSWNEWAEGNVLEPDDIFGTKLLNIIKKLNNK